jgi:soluble lytic murein transglycosylase
VPQELWPKLERWLAHALKLAERYQIDPIWVLSVMWTESHFHSEAESPKSAFGLMQIMPETAGHLALHMGHLLKRNLDFRRPKDNLEMGIFYLRWLHERFGGNYTYATVAYNMGPYWVQKRLKEGGPVGVSNNYLNKVRAYYDHLSSRYTHLIAQRKLPYLDSLVFIDHKRDSYLAHYWNGLRPWLTDKNAWGQLVVAFNQFPAQSHGQL